MNKKQIRQASDLCFLLGFLSVLASIGMWFFGKRDGVGADAEAHGERYGIFVGLWAPTFLIISDRLKGYADDLGDGKTLP